ncbi:hypothetical protein BJ742DRAFT_129241 [Cladochytrium replicatum]|nr:hypothetical protein BJ742DRAFT_129241 [Cladochytrium replicatum]
MLQNQEYGPYWLEEFIGSNPLFSFAAASPPMSVTNVYRETKMTVPFACAATMLVSEATVLLRGLAPTLNTRLYLMNANKLLITTNMNISTVTQDGHHFVSIANATDPYIAEIGSKLNTQTRDIQSFTTSDGTVWKVANRGLNLKYGQSNFTLSIAIPRKDFFESVETSIHRGITTTIVSSVVGVVLALGVVIMIISPLKRMINNMSKATKFEFSTLEESLKLTRPSIFTELRTLQETFAVMVKTFAEAIQRNKSLMSDRRTTQSESGRSGA